jgi:hypothetical protein
MMQKGMGARLVALCFDANDPLRLARFWARRSALGRPRFWADALHWDVDDETHDEIGLVPTDDTTFRILFLPVPEQKAETNRLHIDLTTTSIDDQKETVARLVELGARHIDIEGNELERSTRMAVGLGSGRRNRDPVAGRHRSVHHLGWSAACPEDREEQASSRHHFRPTTSISKRRSTASPPLGRLESTSAKAMSVGWP